MTKEQELRLRPYNAALNSLTENLCSDIGLGSSDVCLFETRVAFDCLLRKKVTKFGDLTDNLGACSNHIDNMKQNIGKESGVKSGFSRVLEDKLDELNYMRKSFV